MRIFIEFIADGCGGFLLNIQILRESLAQPKLSIFVTNVFQHLSGGDSVVLTKDIILDL
jgi:hypothetical protein